MDVHSLPPGVRFHPTDEELITYYLTNKVSNVSFSCKAMAVIDLNKCEPWDLPYKASLKGEKEWYFFSLKDRKYPTGLRTNRATEAGYWKTTGKDKEIYGATRRHIIGMKKTLVFYKGRAPTGVKSDWVIHEYRLDDHSFKSTREEWVVCRVFKKTVKPNSPTSSLDCLSENCGIEQLPSFNPCTNPNPSSSSTQYPFLNSNYEDAVEGMNRMCNWLNPVASSGLSGNNQSPLWQFSDSNITTMSSLLLKALQLKNAYRQQQQSMGEADYSSFLQTRNHVMAHHGEGQGFDEWGSHLMNELNN